MVARSFPLIVVASRDYFDSRPVNKDSFIPQTGTSNDNSVGCAAELAVLSLLTNQELTKIWLKQAVE